MEQKHIYIHDRDAKSAIGRAMAGAETYPDSATAAEKAMRSRTGRNQVFALVITATPLYAAPQSMLEASDLDPDLFGEETA